MTANLPLLRVDRVAKRFTLHHQEGTRLDVLADLSFDLRAGECVALVGPSGIGKSTVLRLIYGNYRADQGRIQLRVGGDWIEVVDAAPRTVLALRRQTIGYVSQFLRALPRVPAIDVVAEPLLARGVAPGEAAERAGAMLDRLGVPRSLWGLAPATFSGGEQQRVNIARGFVAPCAVLLLDEPTASLDAANRARVVALIRETLERNECAILGIFHDEEVRSAVASRLLDLRPFRVAA